MLGRSSFFVGMGSVCPAARGGDAPARAVSARADDRADLGRGPRLAHAPPGPRRARARPPRCSTSPRGSAASTPRSPRRAELTLWARLDGLEPGTVDRLLWEERALVKTWAMRGTLHLLPAAELPLYVAALSAPEAAPPPAAPGCAHHGLERAQAEAMLAAIPAVLDGEPLTREALAAAVAERTGQAALAEKLKSGFGELLKPAAFTGGLCFAPGGRPARALHRARGRGSATWRRADPDAAPAEVGAALPRRLRPRAARAVPALVRHDLARRGRALAGAPVGGGGRGGGRRAAGCCPATSPRPPPPRRPASCGCCPAFDQYVVGAPRGEDAVLPAAVARPRLPPAGLALARAARRRADRRRVVARAPRRPPRGRGRAVRAARRRPSATGAEAEAERLAALPRRRAARALGLAAASNAGDRPSTSGPGRSMNSAMTRCDGRTLRPPCAGRASRDRPTRPASA